MSPSARGQDPADQLLERFQVMVERNLDNERTLASAEIDAAMNDLARLPLGERIAAWADWLRRHGPVEYRFGRAPGGYVEEGRLVDDTATDCMLFMYRATELARSTTAEEAVQFAFGTRFYGAALESVVTPEGKVDYDDPSHLDYSEDMIASGIWGENVTARCGPRLETIRTSRGKTVEFIPSAELNLSSVQSGDIVWFVGEERSSQSGASDEGGTVVHHVGIVDARDPDGEPDLVHAAVKPLPGFYEEAGLVRVSLATYLDRIDRFRGVMVTRLAEF